MTTIMRPPFCPSLSGRRPAPPRQAWAGALALLVAAAAFGGACAGAAEGGPETGRTAPALWSDPRPGTWASPLPVGGLPFSHHGDTALWGERRRARDVCAPGISARGPEVTYALTLLEPAVLRAAVSSEPGVDVDLVLVTTAGQCLMRGDHALERRLPPGRYRLVVDTHSAVGGRYQLDVEALDPAPVMLGSVWNTYYYVAQETDHRGELADTPLLSSGCDFLADVPKAFHDDLCIEGSGLLSDGRIVNYSSSCTRQCFAAVPCGRRRYKICYRVLDPERYPWGMGSQGRVLEVDRSIAVDPKVIPLGTVLYLPELDGALPPGRSAPHDGCVRADDVGGAIKGEHIDLFASTRRRWRAWERILPTRSWFTVIMHHPRCDHVPGAAGGGIVPLGVRPRVSAPRPAVSGPGGVGGTGGAGGGS